MSSAMEILENTRNNEKKSFPQGISVYNMKKTLGQQKECQRPAAMQLVAPQAKFLVRTIESKSWKKITKNNSEIVVIDDVQIYKQILGPQLPVNKTYS